MDIEKLTKKSFQMNVIVAIVFSGMIVTLASLIGRGTLNLHGSLTLEEPTDVTVIRLIEPYELIAKEIYQLPKREDGEWRYSIESTNGDVYFVRIDKKGPPWHLAAKPERLKK